MIYPMRGKVAAADLAPGKLNEVLVWYLKQLLRANQHAGEQDDEGKQDIETYELNRRAGRFLASLEEHDRGDDTWANPEWTLDVRDSLVDLLGGYAPPGHRFGQQLGDYGYWPKEAPEDGKLHRYRVEAYRLMVVELNAPSACAARELALESGDWEEDTNHMDESWIEAVEYLGEALEDEEEE